MSNVERRMSNVEGGNFETKKEFGIIGKECRMSNAEYRISKWRIGLIMKCGDKRTSNI